MLETDVLIVGAGPAGLTLAIHLQAQGLRVRLIDRMRRISGLSRAIGVHARTLESLEPHGLAAPLVEAGLKLGGVQIYSGGKVAVDASLSGLPTRYPFVLCLPQSATEQILSDHLRSIGGEIERGVELLGLDQDPAGVTARLSDGSLRARWLVGCDGAHSTVRHALGLQFHGHPYPERLVLGDVRWDTDLPRDRLSIFLDPAFLACFPLPDGSWRIIATEEVVQGDISYFAEPTSGQESQSTSGQESQSTSGQIGHGQTGAELPLAELSAIVARRSGRAGALSDPAWLARFRIHARQAERYRAGRVFLAGDAAHIHSPVGAQGMNTGMQDAINLAWKLALATRLEVAGEPVPEVLLESYQQERHPVAAGVLTATDVVTRLGLSRSPLLAAARGAVAGFVGGIGAVQRQATRTLAELEVGYPRSPLVAGEGKLPVAPGERLPVLPTHGGHELVLLAGAGCSAAGRRRLRICAGIAREIGMQAASVEDPTVQGDGLIVARPDGYAGLCLSPADPERLVGWLDLTGLSAVGAGSGAP